MDLEDTLIAEYRAALGRRRWGPREWAGYYLLSLGLYHRRVYIPMRVYPEVSKLLREVKGEKCQRQTPPRSK